MTRPHDLRIGFLGAGKMATALARGWLGAQLITSQSTTASDPLPQALDAFRKETGATVLADNKAVVERSNVLILAVKPQNMSELLADVRPALTSGHLAISIAAGITLAQIAQHLASDRRLVRVMPNTPCLVNASASAYAATATTSEEDIAIVDRLFNAVGKAYRVPEKLLDAVTGLSGSGPAFVFMIIEALSDGGVKMGLPRDIAVALAAQTVFGSAKLLLESGQHPGLLKDMVASPAGTTIAGIHALERGGLRSALMEAVEAATKRSMELGNK
jgi:pyrroline-5-carboxylate reductase